jgi:hypothetical protein
MPNSVTYDAGSDLILISCNATVNSSAIHEIASAMAVVAKKYECFRILSDFREATLDLSLIEIYDLPKLVADILSAAGLQVHKYKRALVVTNDMDDFVFFETVSRNRGQPVMLFRSIEKAKEWLAE